MQKLYNPFEVIVAGMTFGIYETIDEAVNVCKSIPGARIRSILGYNL